MAAITSRLWWIAKNVHRVLASEEAEVRSKARCNLRADYEMLRSGVKDCTKRFWCCDCKFREDEGKEVAPQGPLVLFEASTLGLVVGSLPIAAQLSKEAVVAVVIINIAGAIAMFLQTMVLRDRDSHNYHTLSRHSRRLAWSMLGVTFVIVAGADAYWLATQQVLFDRGVFGRKDFKTLPVVLDFDFEKHPETWGGIAIARVAPKVFGGMNPSDFQIECYVPDELKGKVSLGLDTFVYEGSISDDRILDDATLLGPSTKPWGHYVGVRCRNAKPGAEYVVRFDIIRGENIELPDRYKAGLEAGDLKLRPAPFARVE